MSDKAAIIRKIILVLFGFIPLPIGFLLSELMMVEALNLFRYLTLINVIFYLIWGFLGFALNELMKNKRQTLIFTHIPAFLALVLLFVQEVIIKMFWLNIIGRLSQYFFMPVITINANITGRLLGLFSLPAGFFTASATGLLLMVAVFALGMKLRKNIAS